MKKQFIHIILTIILITAYAFPDGSITNITINQRTDGSQLVDIYYDLTGSESSYHIGLQITHDNGSTFTTISTCTGDYGNGVATGTGKHIIWNVGKDIPESYSNQARIQITATIGSVNDAVWCTIPAGDYTYGQNDATQNIDYNYEIMKYEVTNAQYIAYLEEALAAGEITISGSSVSGDYIGNNKEYLDLDDSDCRIDWNGNAFSIVSNYDDHPVVEVTWYGANAYAEHYGWKLPTEQEWEKAARGNTGYNYPWGDDINGSKANYWNSGDPFDNGTTPVGYYNGANYNGFQTTDSPSPYGAYDMAGNVWEWTDSWYNSSYRVVRGGSWSNNTSDLRSWDRGSYSPSYSTYGIGFRCSRTQ